MRHLALPLLLTTACSWGLDGYLDLAGLENQRHIYQMRFGIGGEQAPSSYRERFHYDTGGELGLTQRMEDATVTTGSLAFVRGTLAPAGFLYGVEGVYGFARQETKDYDIGGTVVQPAYPRETKYETFGGNVLLGCGLDLTHGLHIEALGVLGGGSVRMDAISPGLPDRAHARGTYWNVGARAGIYQQLGKCVVGACAGYLYGEMRATSGWNNGYLTQESDVGGPMGRLEFGFAF